jgi:hypothetical protein
MVHQLNETIVAARQRALRDEARLEQLARHARRATLRPESSSLAARLGDLLSSRLRRAPAPGR